MRSACNNRFVPRDTFAPRLASCAPSANSTCGLSGRPPSREQLLQVWGVGPETADSILLYAYAQIEMVIDAYTLRVLRHHGYQRSQPSYAAAKTYCERKLPRSLRGYQEFHALMVEHAKWLRAAASRKPPSG